jgi:hypothetical protein
LFALFRAVSADKPFCDKRHLPVLTVLRFDPVMFSISSVRPKVEPCQMDAAMGRLKKICGSEFFDAVASGAIKLRVHEIVEYAEKDAKVMQRLKPLLEEGVGLRKALSVNEGVITAESRFELAN